MKPIIFNTQDVQAILEGRKTQTRRAMKDVGADYQFLSLDDKAALAWVDKNGEEIPKDVEGLWACFECDGEPQFPMFKSRYQTGDVLWVRETFLELNEKVVKACFPERLCSLFYYKATRDGPHCFDSMIGKSCWKWRPSIHMPREAARIFLRMTDVRVERVQDISIADAVAEGFVHGACEPRRDDQCLYGRGCPGLKADNDFAEMWESANKRRGYGWNTNPWVWVYEFERISEEEANHG